MLYIRQHLVDLPSTSTSTRAATPLYTRRLIALRHVTSVELQKETGTLRIKLVGESAFENIKCDADGEEVQRVFNELVRHARASGTVIEL